MKVQFNTSNNIRGSENFAQLVESKLEHQLARYGDRITRIEMHLDDINGPKGGEADKRCTLEARLAGLRPIAVSEEAATLQQAIAGATSKLKSALDSELGKLDRRIG